MVLHSCYKEVVFPLYSGEVFELSISPEMQDFIFSSRDTAYTIEEADMELLLDGKQLDLKEIYVRGRNALQFQRKSFGVKLNTPITMYRRDGAEYKHLSRFKLIALAMDYTYIENRIAFGILEKHKIMPLFYRYIELKMNGSTQGVYLLIEDPEQYSREQGSEYIIRRGYHSGTTDVEYDVGSYNIGLEIYEESYREIYSNLALLQGEALYSFLDQRLNLEQYFRKIGLDYLLKNGDYTDELYLYAHLRQDDIFFNLIPWDYDDLFSPYPHEVGRAWAVGKLFGERSYSTLQDVLDVLGDKMIYSIEDDLDYAIATDSFMYARYESTLAGMINSMTPEDFDVLFEQVKDELTPFYIREEVVLQSRFDRNETTMELWESNMEAKKSFLKERLASMQEQLNKIQP
jgi:spore coat protein H